MRYRTIVADPPWDVKAGPLCGREGFADAYNKGASRDLAYPSMTVGQITALPVGELVADDSVLFLWVTNGYLPTGFEVLKAWGFTYSTTLVWTKRPMGFGLGGAFGISTEFILYGRRGSLAPRQRISGTWFNWTRPYDGRGKPKHSAKPPHLQDIVSFMFDGPYLELFARSQRLGWDTWGDQAFGHVDLESMS